MTDLTSPLVVDLNSSQTPCPALAHLHFNSEQQPSWDRSSVFKIWMAITNFPPKVIGLINIYTNNVGECLSHHNLTEHISKYLTFVDLCRTDTANSGHPLRKDCGETLLIKGES